MQKNKYKLNYKALLTDILEFVYSSIGTNDNCHYDNYYFKCNYSNLQLYN